jgi:pimeloyl-ACP methyl ester carboxylesterase
VHLLGYSLGAMVALHAAALRPPARSLAGVAAFGGWTPMRTGGGGVATGGNRRVFATHALLPRLGYFEGDPRKVRGYECMHSLDACNMRTHRPAQVPYDYDELISSLAPMRTTIYAPARDRFANASDVAAALLAAARAAWAAKGAASNFSATTPDVPSDFKEQEVAAAVAWAEASVV